MPLPQAVIEANERADALIAQIQQNDAAPAFQPPAPPAPAPAPAEPQAPAQPAAPASQPPVAPADQSLEHRFSVLQGKYNAEVPRLNALVRDQKQQLEAAHARIHELQEQLGSATPSLVKPEEVDEFGAGLIDVVRRAAREEQAASNAVIEELRAELNALRGGVATNRQEGFFDTLVKAHSDWAVINGDAQFHKWLEGTDELTGDTYQDLLDRAQAQQDGKRAAAIFTAFKTARNSWAANANAALANQLVPSPGSPAQAPVPPQPISRAAINAHFEKVRRGGYASEAEAKAAEDAINRAVAEGRIT